MQIDFVDSRSGEIVLRESDWKFAPPHEGDVLELHSGRDQRWFVEELVWVFASAAEGKVDDIAMKSIKVMVCREEQTIGRSESGEHRISDPVCECGHKKSMHAPSRCLGDGSTCQCHGFKAKA
jgi:hypothetical protein